TASCRSVMLAASYWSLLAPAIEMAEESGKYGHFAFFPVAVGSALGALFVYITDLMMPILGVGMDPALSDAKLNKEKKKSSMEEEEELSIRIGRAGVHSDKLFFTNPQSALQSCQQHSCTDNSLCNQQHLTLFLLSRNLICVCSRPGTASEIMSVSFRNLAVGIGIQNFPEGLAVSLPLRGSGVSTWYGQLSGMVEPLAGLLGAVAVVLAEPLLPYALAFAAGAMVYVVSSSTVKDCRCSHDTECVFLSHSSILGFIVMMSLDVGLAELFHWTNLRMSADCTEKRDQSSFSSQWIGLLISGLFFYLVYFVIFLLFIFCFIWKPVSATG
uniref:Zinc transporter ZIP11 n=1 Tax=Cyprinus carpio TaxID=7962 RepID=A0A8C2CEU4_CYPCA